jgi:hypothetical protein
MIFERKINKVMLIFVYFFSLEVSDWFKYQPKIKCYEKSKSNISLFASCYNFCRK